MVITPMMKKTFYVHLPEQKKKQVDTPAADADAPLVMKVRRNGDVMLNGNEVAWDALVDKLRRVFAARDDHVLFFDADAQAPYGRSVEALDRAREGGAVTIAILTNQPEQTAP